jgi:mono/diheme cytochrome c family protein
LIVSVAFFRKYVGCSAVLTWLLAVLGVSCQNRYENEATQDLSQAERVRYRQYMVQGQTLYRAHCSNCHQEDGAGLRRLIPPLAQSDYMLSDVNRTLCLIKNGLQGPIVVNDTSYNQMMPANEALRDIEIAQIATYIYNQWGHAEGFIPTTRVAEALDRCAAP